MYYILAISGDAIELMPVIVILGSRDAGSRPQPHPCLPVVQGPRPFAQQLGDGNSKSSATSEGGRGIRFGVEHPVRVLISRSTAMRVLKGLTNPQEYPITDPPDWEHGTI